MKILKLLFCATIMLVMVSCGNSGYSRVTCEELENKIKNNEELTEQDYNTMIDQTVAALKIVDKKTSDVKDNPEKLKEVLKDEDLQKMSQYALGFAIYLGLHEDQLSPQNLKKFEDAQKEIESLRN